MEDIIILEELEEEVISLEEPEEDVLSIDEEQEEEISLEEEVSYVLLDYNHLRNKPSINEVELIHDKSFEDLGVNTMTNFEILETFNRVFGGD